jgi:hypothetical protein
MKPLILAAGLSGLFLLTASPGHALTIQAECKALFEKADENHDGSLANGEMNPFAEEAVSPLSLLSVSEEEFLVECGAHVLQEVHRLSA